MTSKPHKTKVLTDSEVNRMYQELENGQKPSEIVAKRDENFKNIEKMRKMKDNVTDELEDFVDDSPLKLKNTGNSLKKFGSKYYNMTRQELEEGQKYLQNNIPTVTKRLKDEMAKSSKSVQDRIQNRDSHDKKYFTGFVERMYGASTLGRQYGHQSIKLLRDIAELRQANLITDSEYEEKKKELLRRI